MNSFAFVLLSLVAIATAAPGGWRCGRSPGWCKTMCSTVVQQIVKELVKKDCAEIVPEEATFCEVVGFGPEDPLADICAAIVTAACPTIAAHGVTDISGFCDKLGYCNGSGDRCGCLPDGECADFTSDCCSHKSHTTLRCEPFKRRCGCVPDGQCVSDGTECCSGHRHFTF